MFMIGQKAWKLNEISFIIFIIAAKKYQKHRGRMFFESI